LDQFLTMRYNTGLTAGPASPLYGSPVEGGTGSGVFFTDTQILTVTLKVSWHTAVAASSVVRGPNKLKVSKSNLMVQISRENIFYQWQKKYLIYFM
jgi:hypothetical protein